MAETMRPVMIRPYVGPRAESRLPARNTPVVASSMLRRGNRVPSAANNGAPTATPTA
jgi:hypothetical protein